MILCDGYMMCDQDAVLLAGDGHIAELLYFREYDIQCSRISMHVTHCDVAGHGL